MLIAGAQRAAPFVEYETGDHKDRPYKPRYPNVEIDRPVDQRNYQG